MLIKNVRIVDWCSDFHGSVLVQNGIIAAVGANCSAEGEPVLDGHGLTLMPAFADLHAHFRDPGLTHKEDLVSGSRAAVKGGYTLVNLMANTKPIISSMEEVEDILTRTEKMGLLSVHQVVSITDGFDGKTLSHLNRLDCSKVRWLSDDGVGVMDSGTMLLALEKAKELGFGLMCHEEDLPLVRLDSALAEELMTYRDVELAKRVGARLHVCHVSLKSAMKHIERAKEEGAPVTCEVAPHHIYWNDGVDYRVNPPLRPEADRRYLIEAIKRGVVDAIATDHAPHTPDDKKNGANGISGIEFAFSICNTVLVQSGEISLSALSRLMSKNPAEILGAKKGRIEVGYDADLVLVDPAAFITADVDKMASKGKNTPIHGDRLFGSIKKTLFKGEIVYEECYGPTVGRG